MNKIIIFFISLITSLECFAQSDLSTFNLKEGVTKCYGNIYDNPNPGANIQLTFDTNGKILTIDGEKVSDASIYKVKRDDNRRIASMSYTTSFSSETAVFTYDADGRVSAIRTKWESLDTDAQGVTSATLMWNDKDELYQIEVWDSDNNHIIHNYEYIKYDEKGNWIERIHRDSNGNEYEENRHLSYEAITESIVNKGENTQASAPIDNDINNDLNKAIESNLASRNNLGNKIFNIIFYILFFCGIVHCLYEYFFKKLRVHLITDFQSTRLSKDLSSEMSNDEICEFDSLIKEIETQHLTHMELENEEIIVPTSYKQMQAIRRCILRMEEIAPTRQSEVDEYNKLVEQYNICNKRFFTGSKIYLYVVAIVGILLCCFGAFFEGGLVTLTGAPFYYLSSSRPVFMMLGKEMKGKSAYGSNFLTMALGGILGYIGAAAGEKHYKRYVRSNGDKTSWERDYEEELGSFAMKSFPAIIMLIVLFFVVWIVNIINYFRNYVIYK